jgi:hypothetical protein
MHPEELVKILAADATPVRRLSPPMVRLLIWLGISVAYAALVVWLMGLRADIASKLADTRFAVELAATFNRRAGGGSGFLCRLSGRPIWSGCALPAGIVVQSLGEGCWRSCRRRTEGLSVSIRLPAQHPAVSLVPGL